LRRKVQQGEGHTPENFTSKQLQHHKLDGSEKGPNIIKMHEMNRDWFERIWVPIVMCHRTKYA